MEQEKIDALFNQIAELDRWARGLSEMAYYGDDNSKRDATRQTARYHMQIEELRAKIKEVSASLDKIEKIALNLYANGGCVSGVHVVPKQGSPKWVTGMDEKVCMTLKRFGIEPFNEPKLLTPTEAIKRLDGNGMPLEKIEELLKEFISRKDESYIAIDW